MKLTHRVYFPFFLFFFIAVNIHCSKEDTLVYDKYKANSQLIDTVKLAQKYFDKGTGYKNAKNFDSAFYFFNASKILYAIKKDSLRTGFSLIEMARIQYIAGDYFGSEATATEALSYYENLGVDVYTTEVYNILGMNYKKLLNYDEALHYYNKSLKIVEDPLSRCIIRNNMATLYMEMEKYELSFKILNELNQSPVVSKDSITKARVLTSLGRLCLRTKNPKAFNYIKKGLRIRERLKDPSDLLSSYVLLSEYYVSTDKRLAKKYAEWAYGIAHKLRMRVRN